MKRILLATVFAAGISLAAASGALAAPTNGTVIGGAAAETTFEANSMSPKEEAFNPLILVMTIGAQRMQGRCMNNALVKYNKCSRDLTHKEGFESARHRKERKQNCAVARDLAMKICSESY